MNLTTGLQHFLVYTAPNSTKGVCVLTVWNVPDKNQTLVICSETHNNPGASITNSAETLWPQAVELIDICGEKLVNPIFIEHYANPTDKEGVYEETFDQVVLNDNDMPGWKRIASDPAKAAQVLGYPVNCLLVDPKSIEMSGDDLNKRVEVNLITGC